MKSPSEALFPILIVAGLAAATAWYYQTEAPLAHALVGVDPSLSVELNCAALRQAGEVLVKDKQGVREGSTLSLLAMGDDPRAPEPDLKFSGAIPVPPDRLYGRGEEKFEMTRAAFFDQIENACAALEPSRHSPIYRLVAQAISHLRSRGCNPEGRCYALIKTDLIEDVDVELRSAIAGAGKEGEAHTPPELAGSLDNAGIEVTFCGTAEVRAIGKAKQPPATPEARSQIWAELFTEPGLVSFQPFCGEAAGVNAKESER